MRLAQLIGPELETLLLEKPSDVRELLDELHPQDIADIVGDLDDERATALLTELPPDYAAQVFERLDEERQERLTHRMGVESTAKLAIEMDADERADFFSQLPPDLSAPLLETLEKADPDVAEEVEELTRWPKTSAGGLMTTDVLTIRPRLLIKDAIAEIRRRAGEAETVDVIFVVEADERIVGVLSLRQMLLAEPSDTIDGVMTHNVISVPPEMDQEDVARKLAKYDFNTLPVVDSTGKLLGAITADDILDVLTEEQSEDVQKMGAVEPLREGYFDTSFVEFLRKRAPWLLVLFVGGFFTTTAMKAYDSLLSAVTHLSIYLPLIVSAGGNSGSQSSTLIIRGLAVGEVRASDWWRVLAREMGQGLALGAMLSVTGFARVMMLHDGLLFACLVALAIVGIVMMGCIVGAMLPIALHRVGIDPATSSTPFIASLVDVLGIMLYLSLARTILVGVLPQAP